MKGTVAPSSSRAMAATACCGRAPISLAMRAAREVMSAVMRVTDSLRKGPTIVRRAGKRHARPSTGRGGRRPR
ncbi:hypothetical protein GCM10028812_03420 [Ancylobacter sonchi]